MRKALGLASQAESVVCKDIDVLAELKTDFHQTS